MECNLDCIFEKLPKRIKKPLEDSRAAYADKATEIVLRAERPVCLYERKRILYITENGALTNSHLADGLLTTSAKEIEQIVLQLCDYSIYAYQNEINNGFVTIDGGVRVGICGKAVVNDNAVTNVRDITTLSFRIARDVPRCADPLLQKLDPLRGVLICGSPGSGKTTLLRDMARSLSYRYRVSLLDERGELGAYYHGRSGFSLGLCDMYTGYPKSVAAHCAVRSMSPDIIVCDELGDMSDVQMLMCSLRCGTAFIATVHAGSMEDLRQRKVTSELISTGAFRYIVFLGTGNEVGKVQKIYEMSDSYV